MPDETAVATAGLFTPTSLGGLRIPNRIVVAPMAQYTGADGLIGDWHVQHLGSLAVSGPGLLMIESTSVERAGYGCSDCLALHTDAHEEAFARVIDTLKGFSPTKLGIQLGHSGRKASAAVPAEGGSPLWPDSGGWQTVAPSPVAFGEGWPPPVGLDAAGLRRIREAFVGAARRAARLDLDLLELHGAHGYLLHSFLSPVSNRRTDDYGGSLPNRTRLVGEIMEEIRGIWPATRALGIRLNACDWVDQGLTIEDTVEIAATLKDKGCDYVSISAGAISREARIAAAPGYLAPFSRRVRLEAGIPTIVTGMIYEAELANRIVETGDADAVAIARAFLDDPRWVWRAARKLATPYDVPMQYERAHPDKWAAAHSRVH